MCVGLIMASFKYVFIINPICRHFSNIQDRNRDTVEADTSEPIKLDAAAQAHIEKHRYFSKLLIVLALK